jgi:hypothetical protein
MALFITLRSLRAANPALSIKVSLVQKEKAEGLGLPSSPVSVVISVANGI